ncbi:MAG: response regulator [Methylococcales bacterium]
MVILKPINLLIVEDCFELANVYQGYLIHKNYKVTHIDNGASALISIEKVLPDVLLLDLVLPDIGGHEILEYLSEKKLPIPVVVMTAHGSVKTAVKAMQPGASDFLTKPFDAKRLDITLRNVLKHQTLQLYSLRVKAVLEKKFVQKLFIITVHVKKNHLSRLIAQQYQKI